MEVLAKDVIKKGEAMLQQAEIADYKIDVMLLAEHFLGITRNDLLLKPNLKTTEEKAEQFGAAIKLRCQKIPLQHITGVQEFMGLEFLVNEHVLIPRQDTEVLVELVLQYLKGKENVKVLDVCTGSGCIAISIAKLTDNTEVFASDISEKALEMAKKNNQKIGTEVSLIQSNLFEQIEGTFDVIVSNPPYIRTAVIAELMEEVKDHDPWIALDGHEDGLDFYREITEKAKQHLSPGGMLFYEIGFDQGEDVKHILENNGFQEIHVVKDLSRNDRVVYGGLK